MVKLTTLPLQNAAPTATFASRSVEEDGDMRARGDWRTVAATCGIAAAAIFMAPLVILLSLFVPTEGVER